LLSFSSSSFMELWRASIASSPCNRGNSGSILDFTFITRTKPTFFYK
jgi:hypothetical protein